MIDVVCDGFFFRQTFNFGFRTFLTTDLSLDIGTNNLTENEGVWIDCHFVINYLWYLFRPK